MNLLKCVTNAMAAVLLCGTSAGTSHTPPAVGGTLASLAGRDHTGTARTAASLVGRNGALITFLRSADWCPSCKVQLVELEAVRTILADAGYGLAAVTIDDVRVLAEFAAERNIGFPLLAGRTAIANLGMVDPAFDADAGRRGAPHPAIYVVDSSSRIVRLFAEGERHTVASVLAHMGVTRGVSPQRHETAQLTVNAWTTDTEVAANRRFGLVVDVAPRPSMHVYAPGNRNYRAVKLTIDPSDAVQMTPLEFPKAEPYVYKPLNETVQVYTRPFRLVQEVQALPEQGTGDSPRELTLTGQLEYQACDDVVCYPVKRVPLAWKVKVND